MAVLSDVAAKQADKSRGPRTDLDSFTPDLPAKEW
jgi:hypothetical protein